MFRVILSCSSTASRKFVPTSATVARTISTSPIVLSRNPFSEVKQGPEDAILGLTVAFKKDSHPQKVNLGAGTYRDDNNKPWVLPSVREAENRILSADLDMEYAPIAGVPEFTSSAQSLLFGDEHEAVASKRIGSVQSISGTGALRLAAAFLQRFHPSKDIFLPTPTWGNHKPIMVDAGLNVKSYRYFQRDTLTVDTENMLTDLKQAAPGSIILLHACAHNPTGVDMDRPTWGKVLDTIKEKEHTVLLDCAYQGFASGDPEADAYSVRKFAAEGLRFLVCQSFAKNFGLYGHRTGCLHVVANDPEERERCLSQIKILARPMYSNPPVHGARIVSTVLSDADLRKQWSDDVITMADRIKSMRSQLVSELKKTGSKLNWTHITDQIGMFCFTGLKPEAVNQMIEKHHIYLTQDGRISISGLNSSNVAYVAGALHDVTK